jgi:hypothetical protein
MPETQAGRIAGPLRPLQTNVYVLDSAKSLLTRQWRPEDAPRCAQCDRCTVHPHAPSREIVSCALLVPTEQLHGICFGNAKVEITRVDPAACSARIAGTAPAPPPNLDAEKPGRRHRPAFWSREIRFQFASGRGLMLRLCITTRRRWEKLVADDADLASRWTVVSLWGPLVLAVWLRLGFSVEA